MLGVAIEAVDDFLDILGANLRRVSALRVDLIDAFDMLD